MESIVEGRKLRGKRSRKKYLVIHGEGDPCPRCGKSMQIREYAGLDEKQEQRGGYIRWFCCTNKTCKTTLVMPARYKVA